MTLSRQTFQLLVLCLLTWLIFWNGTGEFRPGMDSMTYGALAKNILKTGDWLTLHYSNQAYSNFYQHPPLGMWLAAIVFSLFGATDVTQKIVPNFFAFAAIGGVGFWLSRTKGFWAGIWASLILLTSVRFTKYSIGLMLDPIQAGLMVWAAVASYFSFTSKSKSVSWACLSGFLLALGFLAKGVPVFAVFGVLLGVTLVARQWKEGAATFFSFVVPLAVWILFAKGGVYLERYWAESVSGRIGGVSFLDRFGAVKNLFKVYWPWLPFFFYGLFCVFREAGTALKKKNIAKWIVQPSSVAALAVLAILCGFTYSGHFLEQYNVIFYPFAALVVADATYQRVGKYQNGIMAFLGVFALFYATLLASFPIHVQGTEYKNPIRVALKRIASECDPSVKRIHVSTSVAEIWYATAMALWNTEWDAFSGPVTIPSAASGSQILLASVHDQPSDPKWKRSLIEEAQLRVYSTDINAKPACP